MKRYLLPLLLMTACTKPSINPPVIPAPPPVAVDTVTTSPITADTGLSVNWQMNGDTLLVSVTANSGPVRFATVTLHPLGPIKDIVNIGTTDGGGNVSAVVSDLKGYELCAAFKALKSCTGLN